MNTGNDMKNEERDKIKKYPGNSICRFWVIWWYYDTMGGEGQWFNRVLATTSK